MRQGTHRGRGLLYGTSVAQSKRSEAHCAHHVASRPKCEVWDREKNTEEVFVDAGHGVEQNAAGPRSIEVLVRALPLADSTPVRTFGAKSPILRVQRSLLLVRCLRLT